MLAGHAIIAANISHLFHDHSAAAVVQAHPAASAVRASAAASSSNSAHTELNGHADRYYRRHGYRNGVIRNWRSLWHDIDAIQRQCYRGDRLQYFQCGDRRHGDWTDDDR